MNILGLVVGTWSHGLMATWALFKTVFGPISVYSSF